MTEKKRELIKTIAVIPSNFEYIAKTGIINGTLLVEIERVMEAYAAQQKSEIAQRCPVCDGKGLVPNCFYATTSGIGSTTQTYLPEKCRTCNGAGVILPPYIHAQRIADKMVEERLREELIKFTQPFYADIETCIHNVDEYLKSREQCKQ